MGNEKITATQPAPAVGDRLVKEALEKWVPPTHHVYPVVADVALRGEVGKKKYGSYLMSHNGRDATLDLYQELCDGVAYLAQEILEANEYPAAELTRDFTDLLHLAFKCRLRLVKKGVLSNAFIVHEED